MQRWVFMNLLWVVPPGHWRGLGPEITSLLSFFARPQHRSSPGRSGRCCWPSCSSLPGPSSSKISSTRPAGTYQRRSIWSTLQQQVPRAVGGCQRELLLHPLPAGTPSVEELLTLGRAISSPYHTGSQWAYSLPRSWRPPPSWHQSQPMVEVIWSSPW